MKRFYVDSIRHSVFLLQSCSLFVLLTRFIHLRTFLVAIFAVSGCAEMLESVFLYNFKPFDVSDSLGENIGVLSLGNVEPTFKNWFRLNMLRPSSELGKQECGSLRHITLNPR